ncbi:MAG: hypothetical protein EOO61_05900 [Hymenobacter sp.]|nr:MAG: hypothetical protein EOO61_05900 [Hymenobacter sp.]
MKIDVQLEFPDEQAASVMRQLQNLPEMTIRFLKTDAHVYAIDQLSNKEALSEQEQHALLDQVFGSWQQEEGEEDLLSQIYGARCDAPAR